MFLKSPYKRSSLSHLKSESGSFVSFQPLTLIAWLYLYGLTGSILGKIVGHPQIGALIGVLIGFYPSIQLGIAGHYGSFLAFVPIPALITYYILSKLHPNPKAALLPLITSCILPFLFILWNLIRLWSNKREK